MDHAAEYRRTAKKLRTLAKAAQFPEVRAELLWLALSYDRLAAAPKTTRIVDGHRVLEASNVANEIALAT